MPLLSADALGVAALACRPADAALLRMRELGGAPGAASTTARRLAFRARASRASMSRSSVACAPQGMWQACGRHLAGSRPEAT